MGRARIFLSQKLLNEVVLYVMLIDVVLAYLLKRIHGAGFSAPLGLLYLLNAVVIFGVYRFWKLPLFEWDDEWFIFHGILPWKKDAGRWENVEKAGFSSVEVKKGKKRTYLAVIYVNRKGQRATGVVPMDYMGFSDKVTEEFLKFLKKKKIPIL